MNGNGNKVEFCVEIPQDGEYQIQTWVHADSSLVNSMFVAVDNLPAAGYLWDAEISGKFSSDFVSDRNQNDPQTVNLTAGQHTLTFANREPETKLDRFEVVRVGDSNGTAPVVEGFQCGENLGNNKIATCVFFPAVYKADSTIAPIVQPTPTAEPTPEDGDGSPVGVNPSPNSCGDLSQEAENGDLFGGMKVVSDGGVTGIGGSEVEYASLVQNDRVEYCFTVTKEADYNIAAYVKAPSYASNSMFWTLDSLPNSNMVWHMNVSSSYGRQLLSDGGSPEGGNSSKAVRLKAGDHIISFYHREPGVILDRFEIVEKTDDTPETPELPDPYDGSELSVYSYPRIDYSNVGLNGGIPTYQNEIRVSGWTESDIERAINEAPPYTRIILPAGVYNIGTIDIRKSNITLVGEGNGCGDTILRFGSNDTGIYIGNSGSIGSSKRLTADAFRNTKVVTLSSSDAGGFNIGDYVMIQQNDDSNIFRADLSRNPDEDWVKNNATQMNKIVGKNGNQLTLEGGLNLDYKTSLSASIAKVHNVVTGVGVENITLERTVNDYAEYGSANIYVAYAANSWVEGVHSKNSVRAHIYMTRSYKNEVRGNFLDRSFNNGGGGHGYGVRLEGGTSDTLVENNIAKLMRHSYIAQIGANGNVFGYNYSADPFGEGFGEIYTDLSVHGGFGHSNLFEGNQAQHAKIDNIHASNSWNIFFRNRLEQDIDSYTYKNELMEKGASTPHIWVHENQYYNTFLANEIGFPGANQATQTVGFDSGRVRDNFTVCKYTTSGDSERGCGRTRDTTLMHGTHDYLTGQTSWDNSISTRSFPASAYKSAKPSFWGNTAWPTFGPDTLNQSEANKIIPAKQRFLAAQNGNGSYCYVEQ